MENESNKSGANRGSSIPSDSKDRDAARDAREPVTDNQRPGQGSTRQPSSDKQSDTRNPK